MKPKMQPRPRRKSQTKETPPWDEPQTAPTPTDLATSTDPPLTTTGPRKKKQKCKKARKSSAACKTQKGQARKRSPATLKLEKQLARIKTIPQLLRLFQIPSTNYVLVGDGSATGNWKYTAGWACVAINVVNGHRHEIYGGANMGTNILAEMMAYVYALHWLARKKKQSVMYIDVFTDCAYVVEAAGNPGKRKAYRELWHMVDAYKRRGMIVRWHWIPRDTLDLNQLSHTTANLARVAMQGLGEIALSDMDVESVYELTPNKAME